MITTLAIAGATALISGLANYAGSRAAAKEREKSNKEYNELYNEQQRDIARRDKKYLDTEEGAYIAEEAARRYADVSEQVAATAVKKGETDQQRLARQGAVNEAYTDAIKGLAANSTAYRQQVAREQEAARARKQEYDAASREMQAQSLLNAGVNVGQSVGTLGQAAMGVAGGTGITTGTQPSAQQAARAAREVTGQGAGTMEELNKILKKTSDLKKLKYGWI